MGWDVCKIGKVSQIFLQTGSYRFLTYVEELSFKYSSILILAIGSFFQ